MYEEVLEGEELDEIGLGDEEVTEDEEEGLEDDIVPGTPVEGEDEI